MSAESRYSPGSVRDAILQVMSLTSRPLSVKEIEERVNRVNGPTPASSIRSYLRLRTPDLFVRESRGCYSVQRRGNSGVQKALPVEIQWRQPAAFKGARLIHADCFDWIDQQAECSIHAVVTDPPYGLHEY